MGPERVVWGSDSVWYGSPQWQIEAMRRLEIPDDIMKKFKWKTHLGGPNSEVKQKIFGLNAAHLYGLDMKVGDAKPFTQDQIGLIKADYIAMGGERSNAAYGYVAKNSYAGIPAV